MYLIKPTSCKFLNFFLALYSFVFNRSTCVKNMKNIGRIVLPIIILLLTVRINAVPVKAFDMIVRNLPNSEQLPTKELLCIFQDSEGYMWYGTEGGGLCRDDGYTVKVFRSDFKNPGILENNSVTCITEDGEGKIWFGTKRGAYILSKTDYEIRALADETIKSWTITTMTATSDGTIWISTNRHLFRYNESGERTGKYILKWKGQENTVNSIYEDKKQTVWVTQAKGGLFCYDKVKDSFISYPWPYDEYPTSMTEDHNTPYYWVTTWGKGIVRFDPKAQDTDKMFGLQTVDNASSNSDARKLHHMESTDNRIDLLPAECHLHFSHNIDNSPMGTAIKYHQSFSRLKNHTLLMCKIICNKLFTDFPVHVCPASHLILTAGKMRYDPDAFFNFTDCI